MTLRCTKQTFAAGLAALALTAGMIPAQAAATTYRDVDNGAWYAGPVEFCQQHGLIDGPTRTAFDPSDQLTRAVLAEALYRLEGVPAEDAAEGPETALPFSDVPADHPNLTAIRWAARTGVVNGYPDGTFRPEDPITREEIAVLLWSCQGRQTAAAPAGYEDSGQVSDWAASAVDWARSAQVMLGGGDNRFLPKDNTTRAQGAALIMSYGRQFYGLQAGYPLPEPQEVPVNPYAGENFVLDENGYLSYTGAASWSRGLDVSSHQKEIDWSRVAGAGMDFAMIRAGYRGYTAGTINKDTYFDYNIQQALANGLEVGVYFFSQALTPQEAEEEARQLLEWVEGYHITFPLVFDWEKIDRDSSRTQGAGGNTVTACALAFCKVIEEAGYTPMTYGSPSKIYGGGLMLDRLQDYPAFWLAHYTRDTAPTTFRYRYDIWQYSSTGRVDGIEGDVDLNICLTDWNQSEAPTDPNTSDTPTPDGPDHSWLWPF